MAKTTRALAFPRAFSIMVGLLTGKVVDVLRVLSSTKTYRASVADITRRLIEKGMAVEAAEYALAYATGKPVELTTGLLTDVRTAMGEEFIAGLPSHEADAVLQGVLSRMWPEIVQAMETIDVRTKQGQIRHRRLLAGPPLTSQGRALTSQEIREQALADVVAGRVEAPKLVPPRTVQEARQQARLQTAADRVAMNRGVSAETLLADTAAGRMAGMKVPDESAAKVGWTENPPPQTGNPRPAEEAETLSPGQMLKQIRQAQKRGRT
jgi:hypothetical protein